ncbi:MAG: threonine synthase [Anaerolineae bacterium]
MLDAVYDYQRLRAEVQPGDLASDGPGHWRYRRLMPLRLSTPMPPLAVGWTPLYEAPRLARDLGVRRLWVKDDGRNPTGSLKDRASSLVLAVARERGEPVVTTASTGNAAAALAGLAAAFGQRTVIFVPERAPRAKVAQLVAYGARVLLVRGNYDVAFELCLKVAHTFGWYCRNTGYNPYTAEGKKTAALELAEQMGWRVPDWVVVPVGDGNIITGVHRGFQDLYHLGWIDRLPRLLGVQATGAAAVVEAWSAGLDAPRAVQASTVADSIASDLPRDGRRALRAVRETGGACVAVTDDEILAAIPQLASGCGVFAEPAAAATLAGLRRALRDGVIEADAEVALLVTGNGLKDVDSLLRVAETPPVIEPDLAEVERAAADLL